jgi:RNA polymerase sigma factor (sigma-70 family)
MGGGGDERATVRALEELYRSRYPKFLRLSLAVLQSREAAADAVQEGFASALRSRHDLRSGDAVEAWVWRMVLNAALDQARRRSRETPVDAPEAAEPERADWRELRAALAELPERQRHTVFLRHYADLSYDEIADVLGVARGTVAATLHAAHEALRARVAA